MSVRLFTGMAKDVTKVVKHSFPKGTIVKNITRHGGKYLPNEVISTKEVCLSPYNPLLKSGIVKFVRDICQDGRVILTAYGKDDSKALARGIEDVKQLISSIKKFNLTV